MPTIDRTLGDGLLPARVTRVTGDKSSVSLTIDTEDHDLDLLRSVANAVRTNPEAVEALTKYAEIRDRLDEYEVEGRKHSEVNALEDEATDVLADLDRDLDVSPGDGMRAVLRREEGLRLYHAMGDWLMSLPPRSRRIGKVA